MKISIIIPMYNSEKYIKECISSILEINENYELIIVNDGSTDLSLTICNEFANNNPKIKIISQQNKGVSSARNLGISCANGDYIIFVDSDDSLESDWYKILSESICGNEDVVFFDSRIKSSSIKYELYKYILGNNKEKIYLSGPYSKAFKTKFIRSNNIIFNDKIINGEDMLFNTEALSLAKNYKIVNLDYYNIRKNMGSLSRKFDEYIFTSEVLFQQELKRIFKDYDNKHEFLDWCNGNHVITIINRVSYINNFKLEKNELRKLNCTEYKEMINSDAKELKRKILFFLIKIKAYFLISLVYHLRNSINIKAKKIEKR